MSWNLPLNGMNTSHCLATYTDPINRGKIDVIYDEKIGFSANVYQLDTEGCVLSKTTDLPLQGIPKEVMQIKDSIKIRDFFRECYFVPEKGSDGSFNRVVVHVTALGGGKFKIPFQPGLALGSVVRGETLAKMEKYAAVMTQLENLTEQITAAEQKIEMLTQKIDSKRGGPKDDKKKEKPIEDSNQVPSSSSSASQTTSPKSKANDALINFWQKEIEATTKLIDELSKKIADVMKSSAEIPVFEGFQQGLESPLDMHKSHLDVQPRGFDTLNFSSQYINMKHSLSSIEDQVKHSSNANDASASGGGWGVQAKGSHAWSKANSERLAQIKQENVAKGVLMINATVTTRHVRSFRDIHFDKMKLQTVVDVMGRHNKEEDLKTYGITVREEGEGENKKTIKELYLLTEAVLGGAFTALVIFLDEAKSNRNSEKKADESGHTTSGSVEGSVLGFNAGAGFSRSAHSGAQSEQDFVNNVSNTNISIELSSQGAIPIFTRDVIEHEIMKHVDLNPAKFELSPQDEAEAKNYIETKNNDEKRLAVHKRQLKMENAQVALMNTLRSLTSTKDRQTVHTSKSVMDAYESFATQITTDSDCGIPVGFNYQVFSYERLQEILKELGGSPSNPQPKQNEGKVPPPPKPKDNKPLKSGDLSAEKAEEEGDQ